MQNSVGPLENLLLLLFFFLINVNKCLSKSVN